MVRVTLELAKSSPASGDRPAEGLKDSPFSVLLAKFADDVMAQLIAHPSADEIIVDEVTPFRFAERDGKVGEIVSDMLAGA